VTPVSESLLKKMQSRLPDLKQAFITQYGNEGDDINNPSDARGLAVNLFVVYHRTFTREQAAEFLRDYLAVSEAQVMQLIHEVMKPWIPKN
jgi:hypothetical protein